MATPPTLPRPGVKVFTEFRTTTATPIVPQMPACIIGIAKEVVEAVQNDGSLNPSALIALPARVELPYVSTPFQYTGLGGLTLQLSVNNGPTQTITFPASPANPTVEEAKAYIDSLDIPALLVDVDVSGGQKRLVLRTSSTGAFASLAVVGGTSLTVLDLRAGGYKEVGRGGYNNFFDVNFGLANYPNPRNNLNELTIDYTTVRAFLATGGGRFAEISDTATFLRGAPAAGSVFDDGDGDNLSPYVQFAGQNFTDGGASITGSVDWSTLDYTSVSGDFGALVAVVTGTPFIATGFVGLETITITIDGGAPTLVTFAVTDQTAVNVAAAINGVLPGVASAVGGAVVIQGAVPGVAGLVTLADTTPGTLAAMGHVIGTTNGIAARTLDLEVDGTPIPTVTFAPSPANAAAAAALINTALAGAGTCVLDGSNQPVITSSSTGATSSVEIMGTGTVNLTTIGLTAGAFAAGRQSRARVQGSADLNLLVYGPGGAFDPSLSLIMSVDGGPEQILLLTSAIASPAAVAAAINAVWQVPSGAPVASLNSNNELVLTSPNLDGGEETVIRINALSTALATLGLTAGRTAGNPYAPAVGDVLYGDGIRLGVITEVTPGGVVNRLRMDTEFLLTKTWANFYIQAQGLAGPQTATRPSADLQIDADSGEIIVKHEIFRSPTGVPSAAVDFGIYFAYTALRRDVSAAGSNSNLLRVSSFTGLEDVLSPVNPENPLALGLYFALLNSPGLETYGLGVSATSADEVFGTLDAWAEAFEFIESKDVYAIAPLTHAIEVATLASAHVTAMSDAEVGLERCVFFNPTRPVRTANTLVGSGSLGNSTGGVSTFDTGLANLPALMAAAGFPAPPYTIDDRIFLRLDNDTNNYLITSIAGSVVTVSTGALAAGTSENNTDGFYFDGASPAFPNPVVDRPFSVFVRGTVVANLTEEAIAYAAIPQSFQNRRMIFLTPDAAKSTVDGLEQQIDGFYVCAALAGATAAKLPSDPLTEVAISGFTGVVGATDRYGEIQYRIMDGGGLWAVYQEQAGAAIKTRHQLTSDMSSIEKREFSILNALDFTAKFLRAGLRNFIGRFNITQNLQSSISTTLDGLGSFLTTQGVLRTFKVDRLVQDTSQPDVLLLDISVGVLYPCNEIKVTLIV